MMVLRDRKEEKFYLNFVDGVVVEDDVTPRRGLRELFAARRWYIFLDIAVLILFLLRPNISTIKYALHTPSSYKKLSSSYDHRISKNGATDSNTMPLMYPRRIAAETLAPLPVNNECP